MPTRSLAPRKGGTASALVALVDTHHGDDRAGTLAVADGRDCAGGCHNDPGARADAAAHGEALGAFGHVWPRCRFALPPNTLSCGAPFQPVCESVYRISIVINSNKITLRHCGTLA
jgi:hypothetical protein